MSKPFENMKSMISEMNPKFLSYLNKTTKKGFMEQGLSEKFIDEIVLASIKCNYGQTTDIHQFVGKDYIYFKSMFIMKTIITRWYKSVFVNLL